MQLHFDQEMLCPLIRAVVEETLARQEADRQRLSGSRLAYSEEEARQRAGGGGWQSRTPAGAASSDGPETRMTSAPAARAAAASAYPMRPLERLPM